MPVFEYRWDEAGVWIPKLMKESCLAKSTSEAVRLIKQGGVTVDDAKMEDPERKLSEGEYLFKVGKRKFMKIKPGR